MTVEQLVSEYAEIRSQMATLEEECKSLVRWKIPLMLTFQWRRARESLLFASLTLLRAEDRLREIKRELNDRLDLICDEIERQGEIIFKVADHRLCVDRDELLRALETLQ